MYQYNDRLTQLFAKYKYIWFWLQCFDPYLGHRQAYIELRKCSTYLGFSCQSHKLCTILQAMYNLTSYVQSYKLCTILHAMYNLTSYEQYCKPHGIPNGIKNRNIYYTF
jgi:hypothetical protein